MKKGVWLVVGAATAWALLPVFSSLLGARGVDALSTASMRAYLSTAILLGFAFRQQPWKRFQRRDLGHFALAGLTAVTGTYSFYLLALERLNFAMAAILLYTAPAFVTIISRFLYKEPFTKQKLAALGLTFIGSFFVVRAYDLSQLQLNALGIGFGLGAGICYSLLTILGNRRMDTYGSLLNCTYTTLFGAIFFLFVHPPWRIPTLTLPTFGLYLSLTAFGSVLPYMMYLRALQSGLDGRDASIIATLEPAIVAVIGVTAYQQPLEWLQVCGIVLTLGGACLCALPVKSKPTEESTAVSDNTQLTDEIEPDPADA